MLTRAIKQLIYLILLTNKKTKIMMHTPHDWRNGADYSDESYETLHKSFEGFDQFVRTIVKTIVIIVILMIIVAVAIWQWENISMVFHSLWKSTHAFFHELFTKPLNF